MSIESGLFFSQKKDKTNNSLIRLRREGNILGHINLKSF